ncbi:MAG: cobalt-precorrin 5A hydrolase [Bacillota bacterium]|nr:cobalt-precorrin 5A hydrolase [Bacillota bacterium]
MIKIFSYSQPGLSLGNKIKDYLGADHYNSYQEKFKTKEVLEKYWQEAQAFIFISSTGIAVRMIKDFIVAKDQDPAIIVIDDTGKNVISLLSGHLGGANDLTRDLAEFLGAYPVITTSTDNHGIEAVDSFARTNGYQLEDKARILPISKLMLEGKSLGFYSQEEKVPAYKNLKVLENLEDLQGLAGLIVVSNKISTDFDLPSIWLYPKNINLGLGCRKDTPGLKIIAFIEEELARLGLSTSSIKAIGTVEAKRNEAGIQEAADYFKVEKKVFTNEQIKTVEDKFAKSDFVKKTIGVYSVAEPSAYLLGGRLITERLKKDGITLAISLED